MNNNFLPYQLKKNAEQASNLATQLAQKAQQSDLNTTNANVAQNALHIRTTELNVLNPPSSLIVAKGDNTTDDTSAIQAIINYAQSNGYTSVYIPNTTNGYKLTGTIIIDISKTKIISDGAKLNFSNSGIAIQFITSSASAYNYPLRPISGLEIVGAGSTNTATIGIQFSDSTGDFAPHIKFHNCVIHEFYKGVTWSNNTWLTSFNECNFYHCEYDVYFPSGLTNSGENIVFNNCVFFNGDYGIYNAGCQMRFVNCSFDYLNKRFIQSVTGGICLLDGCHIEGNADTDYWLYVSGSQSSILVKGGTLAITGAKTAYQIGQSNSSDGGIHLQNLYLIINSGGSYALQSLITGTGTVKNLLPYSGIAMRQGIDILNYLAQGGFEAGNTAEWTSDGTVAPTIDNTTSHSGTQSMKYASTSANYISMYHDVSCNPGDKPKCSFFFKANFNGSADTFYIIAQYFDALGNAINPPTYTLSISSGSIPTALNGVNPTSGWALYNCNPFSPAPAGAVKCRFKFRQCNPSTKSDGLATGWWDDILLTVD
jgi:hypothetical protein